MNINENAKSSATQCAQIRAWLEKGNRLTALQALAMFGCMRLPSRIHDLKRLGLDIISDRVKTESGKYVAEYRMA